MSASENSVALAGALELGDVRSIPAGKVGMWCFLASEIMVFGGLIACYVLFRVAGGGWADQAAHVHWRIGTLNTIVLLSSSLTMVLAFAAVRAEDRRGVTAFLGLTVVLGLGFLAIKGYEYSTEIGEGFLPTTALFWSFYYTMTALHALHVFAGIVVNLVLCLMAATGRLWPAAPQRVEFAGLYWHFVDVVWIFLFPLFYLS